MRNPGTFPSIVDFTIKGVKNSRHRSVCSRSYKGLELAMLLALTIANPWPATAQAQKAEQDMFLDVVVDNRFFQGATSGPVISVRTRETVNLDCLVYDATNRLVAHKAVEGAASQFRVALDHLPPTPRGVYLFCLVASDQSNKRIGVYPRILGGGEIIQVHDSELDAEKRTITYVLPKAACVRLRAGFTEGPYLQPIISGETQPAGRHTVIWDGTGQEGVFTNLYQHPSVQVRILAVTLPVNLLVALDQAKLSVNAQVPSALTALPSRLADLVTPPWVNANEEKQPDFLIADNYTLSLSATEDAASRMVEIRTDCTSANRSRLFNKRFELMLFLDTTYLCEDERSQLPFSYRMSTRGLAPGRHIITVNVIDADSAVGTLSKEFIISQP